MARKHGYNIIRFLIRSFYAVAVVMLLGGISLATYFWVRAEALRDGVILGGPLSSVLHAYTSSELRLAAGLLAGGGMLAFLVFGALGQLLAMARDRAMDTSLQVQLLEDILELNEQVAKSGDGRVDLCEGCGRLGSLHTIESGQSICRECRRQLRAG